MLAATPWIRLEAGDKAIGELVVVADLTAADEAIGFNGDAGGRERGRRYAKSRPSTEGGIAKHVSRSRINRIAAAPSISGIQAGIEAGPGEDRRRWQKDRSSTVVGLCTALSGALWQNRNGKLAEPPYCFSREQHNPAARAGFCFAVQEKSRSRKTPNQYLATTGPGPQELNL